MKNWGVSVATALLVLGLASGCSSDRVKNQAKEAAARYWQDKAYPGKSFDVQVIDAEKTDDGQYQVKGIVDGETRVGVFDPSSENFSEGYYSLAHEREKRIAELEQESQYWKEKADSLDKELYKLKVEIAVMKGEKAPDFQPNPGPSAAPATAPASTQPN